MPTSAPLAQTIHRRSLVYWGIEPTESWRLGDVYERRGHTFHRKSSLWRIESGLPDTQHLDLHVEALVQKLAGHRDAIHTIRTKFQTQIVCVSFAYQGFSWELDFHSQSRATALGIGFWIDAYNFGDHHEQMVELREQLGVRAQVRARD